MIIHGVHHANQNNCEKIDIITNLKTELRKEQDGWLGGTKSKGIYYPSHVKNVEKKNP